ncbi:MAG: 3-dehydroquinate synthase, partial [Planctomycetota bacterium]|nr:3-dehydroquinate synthase [Planctomycetota bacterium]
QIERAAPHLARGKIDAAALSAARPVIRRSAELHARHIVAGNDAFELTEARPLDFGHWSAHMLEQMTDFELKHGEAVAIGIAIDVVYSSLMQMLQPAEADRVIACLESLGFALHHVALRRPYRLLDGLEEFREHLGGPLTITLLEGIGRPVDVHEIDRTRMIEAIETLQARASSSPWLLHCAG